MEVSTSHTFLKLPSEVLSNIFLHLSTPSFLQAVLTCQKLFNLAAGSRDVLLHHLRNIPGIKLGLSDRSLRTSDLFQILRQRAAEHLFGANFTGNCTDFHFQNGTLDAKASYLADSTDYFNISLALKESLTVRHYGYDCALKEHTFSPYADGRGRVLQVVHNKHTISVLYQWTPEAQDGLEHGPIPPSLDPNQPQVTKHEDEDRIGGSSNETASTLGSSGNATEYHLVHYKAYNLGPADFFRIPAPKGVKVEEIHYRDLGERVPVHLAVYNRLKCVIIWDTKSATTQSSSSPEIIMYATDRLPKHGEEGSYTSAVIYPLKPPHNWHKISHQTHGDALTYKKNKEHLAGFAPRAVAFHNSGQRISLYSPCSTVPYAVLYTNFPSYSSNTSASAIGATPRTLNEVHVGQHTYFRTGSPFFGTHTFGSHPDDSDGPGNECTLTYLHLGHAQVDGQSHKEVLCILQSRSILDAGECRHLVNLDDQIRVPNARTKVVARLWGWQPNVTTMTALDTVAISPKGTRIAISCWDKVMVWSLNPEVLCEDWVEGDEDDEEETDADEQEMLIPNTTPASIISPNSAQASDQADDTTSNDDNETSSDAGSAGKETPMIIPTGYYDLIRDSELGYHVELKPIILQLPNGAIARKMAWSGSPRSPQENEYAEEDAEGTNEDPEETRQESELEASTVSLDGGGAHEVEDEQMSSSKQLLSNARSGIDVEDTYTLQSAISSAKGMNIDSTTSQLEAERESESLNGHGKTNSPRKPSPLFEEALVDPHKQETNGASPADNDVGSVRREDPSEHVFASEVRKADDHQPVLNLSCKEEVDNNHIGSKGAENDLSDSLSKLSLPDPPVHDPSAPPEADAQASTSELEPKGKQKEIPDASLIPVEIRLNDVSLPSVPTTVPGSTQPTPGGPVGPTNVLPSTYAEPNSSNKPAPDDSTSGTTKPKPRRRRRRKKRKTEDELIVLTDRGVQLWDLGVWAKGKRKRTWLDERLV